MNPAEELAAAANKLQALTDGTAVMSQAIGKALAEWLRSLSVTLAGDPSDFCAGGGHGDYDGEEACESWFCETVTHALELAQLINGSSVVCTELTHEYEVRSPDAPYFGHDFNDGWRPNTEESAIYLREERGYEVRRRRVTAWEAAVAEPACDCRYGYNPEFTKHEHTCSTFPKE